MFRWHDQAPDSWPGSIPDDLDTLPFLVYMAYIEQCSSRYWGLANAEYLKTHLNQHDPQTCEEWTTRVVSLLWQYGVDRWIDRNASVYGHTEEERIQKRTADIDKSITRMHTHDQHQVRDADRSLFSMPLTERLAQTLHQKRLWTASVEAAYQAWATLQASQIDETPRPLAPLWERPGGPPRVRYRI
jgi:hypothetical protein